MSATLTHTHVRTFTVRVPANPYLVCDDCGGRVEHWRDGETPPRNHPCGHAAGYHDLCPSWGPVDGCQCYAHFGYVPHPPAAPPVTEHGQEQGPL